LRVSKIAPGPLNANELLQRAGFQELVCGVSTSSCDQLTDTLKWQKLFCL